MNIPKRFKMFGHTIDVTIDDELTHKTDNTAEAHYRFNRIMMQSERGYIGRPQSKYEQAFFHELVHFLFYYGECELTKGLHSNEIVVDRLASMLHQAFSTMEYE